MKKMVICFMLLIALAVGCKDEAEAVEATGFYDNEPLVFKEVWLSLEIEDKPTFEDGNRVYLYEGDDFDIVIEKKEPNEPEEEEILICPKHYKRYCKICESIIYKAGWLLPVKGSYLYNQALKEKPEPDEPSLPPDHQNALPLFLPELSRPSVFKDEILFIVNDIIQDLIDQGYTFDANAPTGEIKLIFPEPEETSSWIYITDLNEPPTKVSLDFIPTWPDYIELDKDLMFDKPGTERRWWLPKGTKIYFSDD